MLPLILQSIVPDAKFEITGPEYKDLIIAEDSPVQITEEQFNEAKDKYNAFVKKNEYIANRSFKYPSTQEQLDMIYWDMMNGTTKWKDLITSIKTEHPKG
jgi:hypothetical protein